MNRIVLGLVLVILSAASLVAGDEHAPPPPAIKLEKLLEYVSAEAVKIEALDSAERRQEALRAAIAGWNHSEGKEVRTLAVKVRNVVGGKMSAVIVFEWGEQRRIPAKDAKLEVWMTHKLFAFDPNVAFDEVSPGDTCVISGKFTLSETPEARDKNGNKIAGSVDVMTIEPKYKNVPTLYLVSDNPAVSFIKKRK